MMGYAAEIFDDRAAVEDKCTCPVCLKILECALISTTCGHSVCYGCHDNRSNDSCPVCGVSCSFLPNVPTIALLGLCTVTCPTENCYWRGKHWEFVDHHSGCCSDLENAELDAETEDERSSDEAWCEYGLNVQHVMTKYVPIDETLYEETLITDRTQTFPATVPSMMQDRMSYQDELADVFNRHYRDYFNEVSNELVPKSTEGTREFVSAVHCYSRS